MPIPLVKTPVVAVVPAKDPPKECTMAVDGCPFTISGARTGTRNFFCKRKSLNLFLFLFQVNIFFTQQTNTSYRSITPISLFKSEFINIFLSVHCSVSEIFFPLIAISFQILTDDHKCQSCFKRRIINTVLRVAENGVMLQNVNTAQLILASSFFQNPIFKHLNLLNSFLKYSRGKAEWRSHFNVFIVHN